MEDDEYGSQQKATVDQVVDEAARLAQVEVNDTYVPPSVEVNPSVDGKKKGLRWYHWVAIAGGVVIVTPICVKLITSAMEKKK